VSITSFSINNQLVLELYTSSVKEPATGTKLAYLQAQYKLAQHSNTADDFNRSTEKKDNTT